MDPDVILVVVQGIGLAIDRISKNPKAKSVGLFVQGIALLIRSWQLLFMPDLSELNRQTGNLLLAFAIIALCASRTGVVGKQFARRFNNQVTSTGCIGTAVFFLLLLVAIVMSGRNLVGDEGEWVSGLMLAGITIHILLGTATFARWMFTTDSISESAPTQQTQS